MIRTYVVILISIPSLDYSADSREPSRPVGPGDPHLCTGHGLPGPWRPSRFQRFLHGIGSGRSKIGGAKAVVSDVFCAAAGC